MEAGARGSFFAELWLALLGLGLFLIELTGTHCLLTTVPGAKGGRGLTWNLDFGCS